MNTVHKSITVFTIVAGMLFLAHTSNAHCLMLDLTPDENDQETVFADDFSIRFFGGSAMKLSTLNNDIAILGGGSVGVFVNEAFIIGGDGYSLLNGQLIDKFRYGGLLLGYIHRSRKLIHFSVHSLIGGGTLRYIPDNYTSYNDGFFVFEPGADLVVNITRSFRIGIGGTYRMVSGVDIASVSNVSGPSVSLSCTYRKF